MPQYRKLRRKSEKDLVVYIYVLIDPRDEEIFYVGKARNPYKRLHLHNTKARKGDPTPNGIRIREILAAGHKPVISLVEQTTMEKFQERERHFIKMLRDAGYLLTNVSAGGGGML